MDLEVALTETRRLFDAAIAAVDPGRATSEHLADCGAWLDVEPGGRLFVVAVGKAAATMARAAEDALDGRIAAGLAVTKYGHAAATRFVTVREAGHPTPDASSLEAARALGSMLASTRRGDVVLALISGGASSLLSSPAGDLTLDDLRSTTEALLASGAPIGAINAVRKHLERFKGGGLAALASPARVTALIVSDVAGDPLDVIASGPTVGDTSTFGDALDVLRAHDLVALVPRSVVAHLEAGARGAMAETPKPGHPLFERVHNRIVAGPSIAADAAARAAGASGWRAEVFDRAVTGEARVVGEALARRALAARPRGPMCLIGVGETTVNLRGDGFGGRNTEVALAAAIALEGQPDVAVASLATDGDDGPTRAAGAVATGDTVARGRSRGIDARDALARNDSARFFARAGGLVVTGPTLTNVADLYGIFIGSPDAGG